MIILKTVQEIEKMKLAGKISARALKLAGEMVEPGVSTGKIDEAVSKYIKSQGAASRKAAVYLLTIKSFTAYRATAVF